MKFVCKPLLIAGLLAGLGFSAIAQGMNHGGGMMRHGQGDPAKRQAMMAKHQEALKAKLKLTPAQEGAWTSFTAAMQPPANMPARPDRAAMEKMTTPERIDRMNAMHAQRGAEMAKRTGAVKTFYAVLSSEQKAVFDAQHKGRGGRHGGMHGGMMHHN